MTADTVGGVWTYALDLARGLAVHKVEINIATMGAPLGPAQAREAAQIRNLNVFESNYKLEWMDDPWDDIHAAGEWLLRLEEVTRPQIIHLNGYCHASLPWRAPALVVCHSCVLSWGEAVRQGQSFGEWNRYAEEVKQGLRAAHFVVAPSKAMLEATVRHYGSLGKTAVIPNGRSCFRFHPRIKQPFVFAAGRMWDEAKNLTVLSTAAEGISWPVYVAGEVRDETRNDKAVHLGKLSTEEMADWLGRASVYALPAKYEPFGLSVLEAAISACALVLGDIPSLRENWEGAAMFVNPNDAQAVSKAIQRLIEDPAERGRLAAAAELRSQDFTVERFVKSYMTLYEELATHARGKGYAL